ncbi:uncharacterized protein LOC119571687 [Penaeus monodon]|uniref:uncharacterized protein LOC119571687 n=1 Tax=Penaeus monodon TaxID=6687 RepID=UPI0018A6F8F4|nr:uncharacterized protein LOC119571687 [Penaeus monodon]
MSPLRPPNIGYWSPTFRLNSCSPSVRHSSNSILPLALVAVSIWDIDGGKGGGLFVWKPETRILDSDFELLTSGSPPKKICASRNDYSGIYNAINMNPNKGENNRGLLSSVTPVASALYRRRTSSKAGSPHKLLKTPPKPLTKLFWTAPLLATAICQRNKIKTPQSGKEDQAERKEHQLDPM